MEFELVWKTVVYGFILVLVTIFGTLILQAAGLSPLDLFTLGGRQNLTNTIISILAYFVFLAFLIGALARWLYDVIDVGD